MNIQKFLNAAERYFPPHGSGPQINANATPAESVQSVAERCAYELAGELVSGMLDAHDSAGPQAAADVWNKPVYRWARQYLICRMAADGEIAAIGSLGRLGPDGMNI
ncbi:MAG: hypothetical protein EOM26_14065 [Alphaproteobacteria bacterium]|nr:hypothetical protein [Alphaproteobacteria bacterium]